MLMLLVICWSWSACLVHGAHDHSSGWVYSHGRYNQYNSLGDSKATWIEKYHYPGLYTSTMTPFVNGSTVTIPPIIYTPDYRVEEKMLHVYHERFFKERERPYRISPHYKNVMNKRWHKRENANLLGCYCTTVFRKYHVLAGCAVLTYRHILTTASSTDLVLRTFRHLPTMSGTLGFWYDHNGNQYNSSLYGEPGRIHIHTKYVRLENVNVSHPLPVMYDLSVWSTTRPLNGNSPMVTVGAILCQRGVSTPGERTHSTPRPPDDLASVVGFQFVKAYGRRPMPWYKYAVRTKYFVVPCPKSDWQWFHCVMGKWARFGFDSGGALHLHMERKTPRADGLVGMCAFSMNLRSMRITHYFTVLDSYPVLDWLYDAMLGYLPYEWLDVRMVDRKGFAARPKDGAAGGGLTNECYPYIVGEPIGGTVYNYRRRR